jgi:Flp pilus assembly protein TadG
MRRPSKRSNRRGASLVESAITIPVLLTLALGMIDLGFAVLQNHVIAEASRQGARIASVHGSLAPSGWNGGPWGTTAYSGSGNSTDTIPSTMSAAGLFVGLNASNVTVAVQWPDGGNSAQNGDPVQVTVSTTWTPLFSYIFGSTAYTLSATSMVPIAH